MEAVEKAARNLSRKHEKLPPHRVWRYGRSESEPPPTAPELVGISVLFGAMLRFINSASFTTPCSIAPIGSLAFAFSTLL